MSKDISFKSEARKKLLEGVTKLTNVAAETMGQQGKYAVIEDNNFPPKVTKDGYYSIKNIELPNPQENQGGRLVKEGAKKSAEEAGDGTTTYCVLLRDIVTNAIKVTEAGASQTYIKKGIEKAVALVNAEIQRMAIPIDRKSDMLKQVATISANNNELIGSEIAKAMRKLKENGVIKVDESNSLDSYIDIVDGMKIDRGYISPYFITDSEKMECVLSNPYVLVHDDIISGIKPLVPILEAVSAEGRSVLIIAKDVNNEALATLIQNKVKGGFPVACVHAPGYGISMTDEIEDVAMVTGATVVSETTGHSLEDISLEMLGECEKVIINRNSTVFVGAKGDKDLIKARVKAVKKRVEDVTDFHVREMFEKRIANIDGGIAVFYVGGATESEVSEKKDLIEDAIAATKSAVEMGVVPGGGSSLVLASKVLDGVQGDNADETIGIRIVRESLSSPLKQIMSNAGLNGDVILDKVLNSKIKNAGYNLRTNEICDMIKEGVLDTAKVEISALTNSSSQANLILMSSALITEIKESK
jgi:chaperonin GroEL